MISSISQNDCELALGALDKILKESVEDIQLVDGVPPLSDLTDSNQVFKGKLSVLFVDMRKSSELTEKLLPEEMVKIYRSFIRLIIQAIRYAGGFSRQFAGDGIMGIFQDSDDEELPLLSSRKAIDAARYIITLIDYCLNPLLNKYLENVSIACGVGICTGEIMVTKAGMRGKESDDTSENEFGTIWVGSTTNNASRYCELANGGEIFVDSDTFKESSEDASNWVFDSRIEDSQIYKGYLALDYYLPIDTPKQIDPIKAKLTSINKNTFIQTVYDDTTEEIGKLIKTIEQHSRNNAVELSDIQKSKKELDERETACSENESKLAFLQRKLNLIQTTVEQKEQRNKIDEYNLNKRIFSIVHCKDSLIIELGKDFWIRQIDLIFELGKKIGKSESDIKSDLDCYLVNIYFCLELYEEAYDALCIQAEYGSWLSLRVIEEVVIKSGHWMRLKDILEKRINPGNDKTKNYFLEALNQLKKMGY